MKASDLHKLKEPFPVKWRVQSMLQNIALCVSYVDSRDVQNRLDEVCGPENWQSKTKVEKNNLYTELSIRVGDEWVTRTDVGKPSAIEPAKGETSDSLKRAAVQWGIGRFLYDLEIQKLPAVKHTNGKSYPTKHDKKTILWDGKQLTDYLNGFVNLTTDIKSEYKGAILKLIPEIQTEKLATEVYTLAKGLQKDKDFLQALETRVKAIRNA